MSHRANFYRQLGGKQYHCKQNDHSMSTTDIFSVSHWTVSETSEEKKKVVYDLFFFEVAWN